MSKIGFLTDSCSDIPQELADKYGIEVVGFPINLDGVEYMERKDFTNDQFYQMMRDAQGVPTTAAITQLQGARFTSAMWTRAIPTWCICASTARGPVPTTTPSKVRRCWPRSAPAIS